MLFHWENYNLLENIKQSFLQGEGLEKILNSLIEMVKSLPVILGDVGKRMLEFMKEVFSVNGPPIVEEIKTIVYEMKAFIDGVQQDILKFYNVCWGLTVLSNEVKQAFHDLLSHAIKYGYCHNFINLKQDVQTNNKAANLTGQNYKGDKNSPEDKI